MEVVYGESIEKGIWLHFGGSIGSFWLWASGRNFLSIMRDRTSIYEYHPKFSLMVNFKVSSRAVVAGEKLDTEG